MVLIQDPAKEIYGPAHNAVLQIPGTDEWYIVYHRINKNFIDLSLIHILLYDYKSPLQNCVKEVSRSVPTDDPAGRRQVCIIDRAT